MQRESPWMPPARTLDRPQCPDCDTPMLERQVGVDGPKREWFCYPCTEDDYERGVFRAMAGCITSQDATQLTLWP